MINGYLFTSLKQFLCFFSLFVNHLKNKQKNKNNNNKKETMSLFVWFEKNYDMIKK